MIPTGDFAQGFTSGHFVLDDGHRKCRADRQALSGEDDTAFEVVQSHDAAGGYAEQGADTGKVVPFLNDIHE